MKIELRIYTKGKEGHRLFSTHPEAGYLSGNLMGDIMLAEGCVSTLEDIDKVRNGVIDKAEFGGTASFVFITKDGVKILGLDCIEDGTEPVVYMSLDEYERVVKLWKEFLETKKEIRETIVIEDRSILWEEVKKNIRKKRLQSDTPSL